MILKTWSQVSGLRSLILTAYYFCGLNCDYCQYNICDRLIVSEINSCMINETNEIKFILLWTDGLVAMNMARDQASFS